MNDIYSYIAMLLLFAIVVYLIVLSVYMYQLKKGTLSAEKFGSIITFNYLLLAAAIFVLGFLVYKSFFASFF
jgi:heme/copper-type cytochrome/quinol oxidase subunit 2